MKKLWFLLLLPAVVQAEQCVMQQRTVIASTVQILERSPIRRDIIAAPNGAKKCLVDFRVRVGSAWHTAIGEHSWPGDISSDQACARAVTAAEQAVQQRLGQQARSEQILVCKDRPELQQLQEAHPGTVVDIGQLQPHPNYPRRFWHNGAQCRWFTESSFVRGDMRFFSGIACQTGSNRWVVVDKF
jgi:hypothetical protein